ncbi:sensor histidine kinase, partial [Frankia sp. CNm7]|uniref:histidine kinase dimerization/phospho-acceptor domain-containing protein n=1 Tax=Frankia nepalensis TaxID=1836974 RepID=UPI001D592960
MADRPAGPGRRVTGGRLRRAGGLDRGGGPGRGGGLGRRTALATTAVALLAVLVTGAVLLGQLGGVGDAQARRALGRQADLVVALYEQPAATAELRASAARVIGSQQVSLLVLEPGGTVRTTVGPFGGRWVPSLSPATLRRLAGTHRTAIVRTTVGRRVVVAARPLSDGATVLLAQPASQAQEVTSEVARKLLVACLVALAAATAVGLLLARRLARPLRARAAAAGELADGGRDVDGALALPAGGPKEIAEVADALGGLAGALATSEHRQREFLLSVSHELRTPLTAVRGFAEALADGVTPATGAADAGRVILDEALRLDRLVQDLLDLARLDADDFHVDLAPVDVA